MTGCTRAEHALASRRVTVCCISLCLKRKKKRNSKYETAFHGRSPLKNRSGTSGTGRASSVNFSEDGQIGGGCAGGIARPCNVASAKNGGKQSVICARLT